MENEKKKNSNGGLIAVIIILLVGFLATSSYIVYDKFLVKNEDTKKETNTTSSQKTKEENLDINSLLVQNLYSKVSSRQEGIIVNQQISDWMYPKEDKIIVKDLDEESKMKLVFINIKSDRIISTSCETVPKTMTSNLTLNACLSNETATSSIEKSEIERIYKDLFGTAATLNTSIKINTPSPSTYFYIESVDKYVLYKYEINSVSGSFSKGNIIKATRKNNEIKIYEELTIGDMTDTTNSKKEEYIYTFKLEDNHHYYFYSREKVTE